MHFKILLWNAPKYIIIFKSYLIDHMAIKYLKELELIISWKEFSTLYIFRVSFSHSRKSKKRW